MVYYFIKSNNKIQNLSDGQWTDTELSEPLTQEDFETHGMDYLSTITQEQWAELNDEFEVIMWTDSEDDKQKLILTVPEYKPIYLLENPKLLTWTDSDDNLQVKLNVDTEQSTRYLVSKDGRQTWWAFKEGLQWNQSYLTNIHKNGMTKQELENISKSEWRIWFERGILDFAISLKTSNPNNSPIINNITFNFPENQPPLIESPTLVPDEIHNEWVELRATLIDMEGDQIQYQVFINNKQIYPTEIGEWSPKLNSGHEILKAYNHPYFNVGINSVTLKVKDSRGAEREEGWTGYVVVTNTDPFITLTYTDFSLNATISDEDSDKVAYRILINNKQIFPTVGNNIVNDVLYTDFYEQPSEVSYQWGSDDLIFNEPNIIILEAVDEFGGTDSVQFEIIGKYKGLMFVDENGNYYTTDKGDLLQYLDFGLILAGQTTLPKIAYLRNQNGFDVEDIVINIVGESIPDGIEVKLSKVYDNFEDLDSIKFSQILQDTEQVPFYARILTDILATSGGGVFEINARGIPVL